MGLYFTLVPEREDIEFVTPAPKENTEDILDDGFDPATMDAASIGDTIDVEAAVKVDSKKMKEYEAKAEQIFRKRYTKEAERILSGIYSNDNMNATEKGFMAGSQSTMEDLVKAQTKMGSEAGLSNSRSQLIAGQIIEQVSNKLKAKMREKEKKE